MANITESVSSTFDFLTKLDAFMVAQGWTQDQLDNSVGKWAIHKTGIGDSVYVQARWDTSNTTVLGLYQSTGFISTGTDPGNHTGDSGNGKISGSAATLQTGRHIAIGTPIRYWAYADTHYVHVVVERTTTLTERQFLHMGFGVVDKIGDWTGGAYCYGHLQDFNGGQIAVKANTTILLDGLASNDVIGDMQLYVATLRLSGFPNQPASQWAVCQGANSTTGVDRASNTRARVAGGARGGPIARAFGRFSFNNQKGLAPGYPILNWYWNTSTNDVQPLGWLDDVRGVNMEHYAAGDEIVVGSDTWVVFPTFSKWPGSGTQTGMSGFQGWIYRKF